MRSTYRYDERGRLAAIGRPEAADAFGSWSYTVDGTPQDARLGADALRQVFRHDALGHLSSSSSPLFHESFSFRVGGGAAGPFADGRIRGEHWQWPMDEGAGASRTHDFDNFGRLTSVSGAERLARAYDANGNVVVASGETAAAFAYSRGSNRMVTSSDPHARALTYTATGAARSVEGRSLQLEYDPLNRQPRRIRFAGGALRLAYGNALGAVVRTDGASRRLCLRLGTHPLVEMEADGATTEYVQGPLGLVAIVKDGVSSPVLTDVRGSVRAVCSPSGSVLGRFDYGAFGQTLPSTSPPADTEWIRYRYTGQQYEPSLGLYNYGARLYDAEVGRFLQPDPAAETPSDYSYAANDPIDAIDPDGRVIWAIVEYRNTWYFMTQMGVIGFTTPSGASPEAVYNAWATAMSPISAEANPAQFEALMPHRVSPRMTAARLKQLSPGQITDLLMARGPRPLPDLANDQSLLNKRWELFLEEKASWDEIPEVWGSYRNFYNLSRNPSVAGSEPNVIHPYSRAVRQTLHRPTRPGAAPYRATPWAPMTTPARLRTERMMQHVERFGYATGGLLHGPSVDDAFFDDLNGILHGTEPKTRGHKAVTLARKTPTAEWSTQRGNIHYRPGPTFWGVGVRKTTPYDFGQGVVPYEGSPGRLFFRGTRRFHASHLVGSLR